MLAFARDLIGTQPILAAFLAIALGYLVGQVRTAGFSLGVGGVLFVGLGIGAFAPKAQITGPLALTGLVMFLYAIGILYGRQFFEGIAGAAGRKYNLLALVAVLAGLAMALALGHAFGLKIGHTLGLYAGSMTSTPSLQAARDVLGGDEPSIGYSVAYPFGVIGPILCIYFLTRRVRPSFPPRAQNFHLGEVTVGAAAAGRSLADLARELPEGTRVTMVRRDHQNFLPSGAFVLAAGDGLLVVADHADAIADVAARLGRLEPGRIVRDRSALDFMQVFVGRSGVVGIPLARLPLPTGFPVHLLHVRRYDVDIVPTPELTLEFGDRVGVLMPPDRREEVRRHFGDTVKAAAEFSYVSLGIGMVLGILLGLVPIPIPGVGSVALGIGGGPLIVALILGRLRRTGPLLWVMPLPANIVLRNFGLAIFLAAVGINAGQPFLRTVLDSGPMLLLVGAVVLLTTVLIVLLVGHYLMRIPYDDLLGVTSAAIGNPAILMYSARAAPTDRPDIAYAMIFPSMTIVKVVAVQVVAQLLAPGTGGLPSRSPAARSSGAPGSPPAAFRRPTLPTCPTWRWRGSRPSSP